MSLPARAISLAEEIETFLFRVHGLEDIRVLFAALLLICAKIAAGQKMTSFEFRRTAMDVYQHQKENK